MKSIINSFEVVLNPENGLFQPRLYVVVDEATLRPATRVERLEFWQAFETHAQEVEIADFAYEAKKRADKLSKDEGRKSKMDGVTVLNNGSPMKIGTCENGYLLCVSPASAKRGAGYYTDKPVHLTSWEKKMPGVVVAQNRGMLFSSCRKIKGDYNIPKTQDINWIIVDEKSRKLKPTDTPEAKIYYVGNGSHEVKDVQSDGAGCHWFCKPDGRQAVDLWFKVAKGLYGLKGMLMPGLASDVGERIEDHWNVEREITMGNTILINSSMVKGIDAYASLEELLEHAAEWGMDTLMAQWQSGDHPLSGRRPMGTQANATNLELTMEEITELLKPEALKIWATKFEQIAWMNMANINTSRGRAFAARPDLIDKDVVMTQIDQQAGNRFLKIAQGKFEANGEYLKMFPDKFANSLVYAHGADINDAAKKAAATGLHGQIRVNPAFAGRYYETVDGVKDVRYREDVHYDEYGVYVEVALIRYPHGAPSETIHVRVYLDDTVPKDVIVIPTPVANDDGTIPAVRLVCMRLQGADFDGDAGTAYKEKKWLEAQKRNIGKAYMLIPVNTESTEKDKTMVTDETWESFCVQKVESLSNQVGLIATHLKYLLSQCAYRLLHPDEDLDAIVKSIMDAAIAMGNDIDEFKHGTAELKMALFTLLRWDCSEEFLTSPYYNRYACKYKSQEDFNKAVNNKDGSEKTPGCGTLDLFAVAAENLMKKCGLDVVPEVAKATDGKDRFFYTVHPVGWQKKDVDLFVGNGTGQINTSLPEELEELYGVEPGTKFSAKELFLMLYRDHAATCKSLKVSEGDRDSAIKAFAKLNQRYALAKLTIIAWTRAMKKAKEGIDLTAEEALKVFTTLMVQHPAKGRSPLEVLIQVGSFRRADGSFYEKTMFSAMRCLYYFLDVCGDGLLLLGVKEPTFKPVSDKILAASGAKAPDLDKAREIALNELSVIDALASKLSSGVQTILDEIDSDFIPPEPEDEGGFTFNFDDEVPDEPEWLM